MANQIAPQTPKMYLRTNSVIHIALLIGNVLFALVVISQQRNHDTQKANDLFLYIVPSFSAACVLISIFLFKKQLNNAISKTTLKEKLMAYQGALIQRYAPLNGAALFGIVVYELTGQQMYIIISGLLALYLLFLRPTKDKVENDLDLSYEDKMLFDSDEVLK